MTKAPRRRQRHAVWKFECSPIVADAPLQRKSNRPARFEQQVNRLKAMRQAHETQIGTFDGNPGTVPGQAGDPAAGSRAQQLTGACRAAFLPVRLHGDVPRRDHRASAGFVSRNEPIRHA